jgi:hypothetical protein
MSERQVAVLAVLGRLEEPLCLAILHNGLVGLLLKAVSPSSTAHTTYEGFSVGFTTSEPTEMRSRVVSTFHGWVSCRDDPAWTD